MKIQPECVPCLLKRILFETEQSTTDKALQTTVLRNACKILAEQYDPTKCSATIATKVHKNAYETLKDSDPYAELKKTSNTVALSLVPKVEKLLKSSKDPLKTAILCSIIGNTMDFGIEGSSDRPQSLEKMFHTLYTDGFGYDDYPKLKKILSAATRLVFFTDNCGEIVFDKILCEQLKQFNPSLHIIIVVKGEPVLSDATLEDADALNLDKVADEILTTGCFAVGVDFESLPPEALNALKHADLVVCKGMANYESFSETTYLPIVYLLRTKCMVIARSMDVPLHVNAIKLYS